MLNIFIHAYECISLNSYLMISSESDTLLSTGNGLRLGTGSSDYRHRGLIKKFVGFCLLRNLKLNLNGAKEI